MQAVWLCSENNTADKHFSLILRNKFPRSEFICNRIAQAVVKPVVDKWTVLLKANNLIFNLLFFAVRKRIKVKLIAEAACHSGNRSCFKRRYPACLMIGNRRNMRANRRNGIEERCSVLNSRSFNSVRVIAAPYLRTIVKHTCVKTTAAAAAPLEKHIGKITGQPFKQLIQPENISVGHFAHISAFKAGRIPVAYTAVHIPLDIGDVGAFQNAGN